MREGKVTRERGEKRGDTRFYEVEYNTNYFLFFIFSYFSCLSPKFEVKMGNIDGERARE